MLKFATKKPPRLKKSDGNAERGHHGYISTQGQGHLTGEQFSLHDSMDSGGSIIRDGGQSGYAQSPDSGFHDNKENVGYFQSGQARGVGPRSPNIVNWKAYNVKYGKIGLENEIIVPPAERQVGRLRNGNGILSEGDVDDLTKGQGLRSHVNPGYVSNTLEDNRGHSDMNSNINIEDRHVMNTVVHNYPKGGGYQYQVAKEQGQRSGGYVTNGNKHFQPYGSYMNSQPPPFPASFSTDSNGNFDLTASMSIDSMSTSGDRSSKSISDVPDYDTFLDSNSNPYRLENKPPHGPHKHSRHVHLGRGTHGVCEGTTSPVRPGSTDSSMMTSSLRKSPSFRSGHHVRWGPGVMNSDQGHSHQPILRQVAPVASSPPAKKPKKKMSLRALLNLPKFPLSDDDQTDGGSDSGLSPKSGDSPTSPVGVKNVSVAKPAPSVELACLRYRKEFPATSSEENVGQQRAALTRLNITSANNYFYSQNTYSKDQFMPHGVGYPSMHSGVVHRPVNGMVAKSQISETASVSGSSRSPINSVRPFLINGQSSEPQDDYDNCDPARVATGPPSARPGAINPRSVPSGRINETQTHLQPSYISPSQINHKTALESSDLLTAAKTSRSACTGAPVVFDTFVTLGRPTDSSVTFDTFVTHGRPFATSTPVPNGNAGYARYLGHELKMKSSPVGDAVTSLSPGTREPTTHITQSWDYVPSTKFAPLQMSGHKMYGVPVPGTAAQGHMIALPVSHDSHVTKSINQNTFSAVGMDSGQKWVVSSQKEVSHAKDKSQSPFKDNCSFKQKESPDYDGDEFCDLARQLLPEVVADGNRNVRRKLNFEARSEMDSNPSQVVTSCVSQPHHEYSQDVINHNYSGFPKVQAVPGISQQRPNMTSMSSMSEPVQSPNHPDRGDHPACILDLVYITERIISMSFASEEHDTTYKYNLKEVTRMLKTKHQDNYLVINISDKRQDLAKHCPQVLDYGWPENLAPPLERLCSICKAIDSWLGSDINHVVVVHCKGGRGRIAVVIAAYMRYSNICASADQALDRFAMKRFYDDKLGGLPQPSQRRYVHYFAGLLSGAIQINSGALYLHHILIHGVPNFDTKGGCRPFIKVYQGMHPIFTSGVYNVTDNMQKVCISISPGIPLRGDILIKCYHKKNKAGLREIIWACQFHTCAISHNSLVFSKNELDDAIMDPRFPDSGKVEFVFGNNSEGLVQVADFKSDVTVPVEDSTDALTRWDSYENFSKVSGKETDVNANGIPSSEGVDSFRVTQLGHSTGPVDGSLYAQVNKRKVETQILQQQNGRLHNGGSFNSSLDSVPMGTATTQKTSSSESWSYNNRGEYQQPNVSYGSKSYSTSSASPRSGKVTMEEQSQLDQILSDLLNDQAFVSPKSPSGRSVKSSETRTFKTVEDHISPEGNIVVQRGEVNYKIPEVRGEKHVSVSKTEKIIEDKSYKPVNAFTYTPSSPERSRSFEPIRSPASPKAAHLPYRTDYENNYKKENYSYQQNGPSSLSEGEQSLSWLQQQQAKLREKSLERDPKRAQNEQMMIEELKSAQTQNKYFQKKTESEVQQSSKASSLSNGPTSPNGTTSPYSYTVSRTHTYNSEKSPEPQSYRPHDSIPIAHSHTTYITEQASNTSSSKVSNKPPPSPSMQRTVTPTLNTAPPPVPPPARTSSKDYMQQSQQSRNRSYSGGTSYNQSTSSVKTETHHTHQSRPLQRHYSESAYDREQYEKQQQASRSHTTPPMSPRSVSPHTFQTYKTVYKTVHHRSDDEPDFSAPIEKQIIQEQQQSVQSQQKTSSEPPQQQKPHYITEVIVQRTGGADSKHSTLSRDDKNASDNRLDALERSLQAASHSIIASSPWQQKQQQQQQQQQQSFMKQEESRRFETRTYETKSEHREERQQQSQTQQTLNEPLVPPKKIEVTEEDRITLKPIGPGVHQLEPEGSVSSHTGTLSRDGTSTLGRATTPSFPISPGASAEYVIQAVHEKARRMSLGSNQSLNSIGYHATPPFPVTPRTVYAQVPSGTYQHVPSGTYQHAYQAQISPASYGRSNSQLSLNSVFERDRDDITHYNQIVSRQLLRSANDPLYASIADTQGHVTSPTGTLQSGNMQYQTREYQQHQQQQQYQTSTLPHSSSGYQHQPSSMPQSSVGYQTSTLPHGGAQGMQVSQGFNAQTLPHQNSYQQQQQYKQSYQQSSSSSSSQQYNSNQQFSGQDGGLHVDTNPRMLMAQGRSPSSPGSPPSPGNLNTLRQQLHIAHNMSNSAISPGPHSATGQSSPSVYFGLSRRGSLTSLADSEAVHSTPRFVKDTSKYWYKPNISREEAIIMLKDKMPGTFVVRDSNSFPGAFGLALKVATLPPNVQTKSSGDPLADLVRHFLIEPTSKGVRLRGCSNEPVFGSLASLVYQHSLTPLALPCKLMLPEQDPSGLLPEMSPTTEMPSSASALLAQGAACNVVFLNTVDCESLTGPQAVARACKLTFDSPPPKTTMVHFKVSNQGITLTDNQRKLFFRRHYPVAAVTYCGMDPEDRKWRRETDMSGVADAKVFGFVARKTGAASDNACHLFAELDPDQPASAIVNFVTKVMIGQGKIKS